MFSDRCPVSTISFVHLLCGRLSEANNIQVTCDTHSNGGSMGAERREKEEGQRRKKEKGKTAAQLCRKKQSRSSIQAAFELPVTASVSERAQAKVPMKPGDWKYSV